MAGAGLKVGVEVDAGRIHNAFNRLLATDRGLLHGALANIGEYLVEATQDRFDKQQSPEGKAWTPTWTDYWKAKKTKLILTESRRLRDSIVYQFDGSETLAIGTNVIYAAIHQFGGEIVPKNAKVLFFKIGGDEVVAQRVLMPARPFLGLSLIDREEIVAIIADHVTQAWAGGKS